MFIVVVKIYTQNDVNTAATGKNIYQGCYGHGKPGKVMEFKNGYF